MEKRLITSDFIEPVLTDIRSTWNKVKPGIEKILADNPDLTYIPEDVYSDCVNEKAFLFTSPMGFLVLTFEFDKYTKDKTLYVWIAYTYNKGGHGIVTHTPWLNKLAKKYDCKYLETQSNVPKFEEYFPNNGWGLNMSIYRRTVK
jgi:hypothetical protein